jgi:hypothetical protein
MTLPKGPKYITWSTDSYRHTERVTNSDLHLSGISDASLRAEDHFLPLFAGDHELVPLTQRPVECGIVCRSYGLHDSYREGELGKLAAVMPSLRREEGLTEAQYNRRICDFAYGLNVAVYPDALPNLRSFQLGRAGVMPVTGAVQRSLLFFARMSREELPRGVDIVTIPRAAGVASLLRPRVPPLGDVTSATELMAVGASWSAAEGLSS